MTLVFPDANGFVKAMEQFVDVVEREQVLYHHLLHKWFIFSLSTPQKWRPDVILNNQVVFPVEVKDPGAPVDFYINGKKVKISDSRRSWMIIDI